MASGGNKTVTGTYTGNGGSADILIEDTIKFRPKTVRIISANGEAILHKGMSAPLKVAGATPAALVGLEFTDKGLKISGTDTSVNESGTEYAFELS